MRKFILALIAVMVAAIMPVNAPAAVAADYPVYTFVSVPDLFNADLGDVTEKRAGRGWEPGDPNSLNDSYRKVINLVMSEIGSHNPDGIFVAGDMVEGHWGKDTDNTGIFGPVDTYQNKLNAVTNAGNLYYGEWKRFWYENNISPDMVYPAIGDHEIGDNPWTVDSFKYNAFPTFKNVWARNFTTEYDKGWRFVNRPIGTPFEKTSYAKWVTPTTLLLTLDVFARWGDGVHATVGGDYLTWVKQVLASTNESDTVIVQGHTPVIGPVRTTGSSGLMFENGGDSALWRALESNKVDLYLAGEVHANTARQHGYVTQISHGGLTAFGGVKYIVGKVYADGRIEIEARSFNGNADTSSRLWQTSDKRPPIRNVYDGPSQRTGSMVVTNGVVTNDVGDMGLNPQLAARRRR